jgi:CBS domain-containing protein
MEQTAPQLLAHANLEFLRRFSPFDGMQPDALQFLSTRLQLGHYPAGTGILTPEMGPPRQFFIIERGSVQALQHGALDAEYATLTLGPGECFPIGAISAQRPTTNTYTTIEDSYVYTLPAADFLALMQMSPEFHLFCTRFLASLLGQSRQQLQVTFTQRAAEQHTMTTSLGRLLAHDLVSVTPDTPTRSVLERMAEKHIGCMVVLDEASKPVGILTQSDVIPRIVLPAADLAAPISTLMTPRPFTVPITATAYDAALDMATHGIQHLVVIDSQGHAVGVVSERDLFSLQRISLRQIRAGIDGATGIDALERVSRDIRQLALNLIAQGIAAEQLTQFISALNDALTRRIIDIELDRHGLQDVDYAWFAFGSEGRHEQTLSTDQDNGLLFTAPDEQIEPLRAKLLAFAGDVNKHLARCGFPLCKGNIMACNPELCLTLDEWKQRFAKWIREPDPQALLNASIFFDFRVLAGNERHGEALRDWLNGAARKNLTFLRLMAENALKVTPPLGRFRDFMVDAKGLIDLKKSGARLFVDAARIFALRAEVGASNTAQRLRQAGAKMGIRNEEVSAIIDGFHFIQLLRLRSQHLDTEHDAPGDNCVRPEDLNELDRRILKEAFRQARKLQLRLKLDYQL